MAAYDRYTEFKEEGTIDSIPYIKITEKDSDFLETYRKGVTSLDKLSYDYYGDANYGWLILMANPEYGSMEYNIPDGAQLRIPYPLKETINTYIIDIDNYKKLNK